MVSKGKNKHEESFRYKLNWYSGNKFYLVGAWWNKKFHLGQDLSPGVNVERTLLKK